MRKRRIAINISAHALVRMGHRDEIIIAVISIGKHPAIRRGHLRDPAIGVIDKAQPVAKRPGHSGQLPAGIVCEPRHQPGPRRNRSQLPGERIALDRVIGRHQPPPGLRPRRRHRRKPARHIRIGLPDTRGQRKIILPPIRAGDGHRAGRGMRERSMPGAVPALTERRVGHVLAVVIPGQREARNRRSGIVRLGLKQVASSGVDRIAADSTAAAWVRVVRRRRIGGRARLIIRSFRWRRTTEVFCERQTRNF